MLIENGVFPSAFENGAFEATPTGQAAVLRWRCTKA